jgi:hypothetical protein
VAGAFLDQIHSGKIRRLLASNAVVFTRTSGQIVGNSSLAFSGIVGNLPHGARAKIRNCLLICIIGISQCKTTPNLPGTPCSKLQTGLGLSSFRSIALFRALTMEQRHCALGATQGVPFK